MQKPKWKKYLDRYVCRYFGHKTPSINAGKYRVRCPRCRRSLLRPSIDLLYSHAWKVRQKHVIDFIFQENPMFNWLKEQIDVKSI